MATVSKLNLSSEAFSSDKKADTEPLDPVIEVNERLSEIIDRPCEEGEFEETSPRIFTLKDILEPLTLPSLNNAIYEMGVVDLCWPEITEPVFETRTCFPESYYTNSPKERLILAYAENFRRQFSFHYKFRRPLLLQAPNECGLQKMVCTSIRPTKLCFADTNTWQGIATLVSDYFDYEPLTKPRLLPERIMSPYTAIQRRRANPFELAHITVSWLVGAGYDAYVVVGCAKRDVCMAIRYRTVCPDIPDENPKDEGPPVSDQEPRYRLVPLPDMTSKYLKEMEIKDAARLQVQLDKIENERIRKIQELEAPPPDKSDKWRTHGWVLVLPGFMDIEEPFFIEPSEGTSYPTSAPQYQGLDSVYNHQNYYANLQSCEEGLGSLNYDLADLTCWEHLLAGEPNYRRDMVGVDQEDPRTCVDTEKHLDVPASWVEKLDIIPDEYEQRYPGSHKVIHYKKVLVEKFAPYSEKDGIVKRIKIFDDYSLTVPLLTYEWYKHRVDLMQYVKIDFTKRFIYEKFGIGRKEHLIWHEYSFDAAPTSVEAFRTMEFNYYARLDHLTKLVCTPLSFDEYYTNRGDRLESRKIVYTPGTKAEPKRQVKDITEQFGRNPSVKAEDDAWKRTFCIQEGTIELLNHYAYNFITNNVRKYVKPNLAETAGQILYSPDKVSAYIANPDGKPIRTLNMYMGLCENMSWEDRTLKQLRERETDIIVNLRQRNKELKEPFIKVALFDTDRNYAARKGWMEQEAQKAEVSEREKEAEIDPLAPYLARMFGSGHGSGAPLTLKEAKLVREQCVNDFKAKQLQRQIMVQERFDALNNEYKSKRLWYLANQYILTPEKESVYFATSLESRLILYTPGSKAEPERQLKDIIEQYSRNNTLPAVDDVWKKIFHIQEETIELLKQYAYNFVTNNTRRYIKPNLAETGGKILFYPDKTTGYIADPCSKPERPLNVYVALCENMEWEYQTRRLIRDRETDTITYLRERYKELTEPRLQVYLFDTERNEAAKKGWKEQEMEKAEVSEREKESEIDPLAPYLARMFGSGHGSGAPLTLKEAKLVREQCVNDFKAKQLQRQIMVQERFDALNNEYKAKHLWYLANQYILTPEKESAYFALSAELAFQVHTLEIRLSRFTDLSAARYKVLEDYLDKHPLLKDSTRVKHYYGVKLESRKIVYSPGTKADPKRHVKDITEQFSRNPSVEAEDDAWKRTFHIQEGTIDLLNHYAYNFITNNSRKYVKPNLAETAGQILYCPDKVSAYIASPNGKPTRTLNVFMGLCENIHWEENTLKHLRAKEADFAFNLQQRHKELTEPLLKVALFDTGRNYAAKKGWMEQEALKAEVTEREKVAGIDPLAPYLARMFGSGHGPGAPLTSREAYLVRDQCINDFKARLLRRQVIVQERFDELSAEYKAKHLWYLANQYILSAKKESEYFSSSAEMAFQLSTLELRMSRAQDYSKQRFQVLMDYLDKHPLLANYTPSRHLKLINTV